MYDTTDSYRLVRVSRITLSPFIAHDQEGFYSISLSRRPIYRRWLCLQPVTILRSGRVFWRCVISNHNTKGRRLTTLHPQYKLHILSLAGDVQGTFSPEPDPGFGIRNAAWHPTGMFIAVAGWDDKVHVSIPFTIIAQAF